MQNDELVERARELLPALRERARGAEQLRRIPDETAKDLLETGILRALQPARFGGGETDPLSFFESVIEIGSACASSAWFTGVVGVHNWQLALFPDQAQQDVWGADPAAQISSSYAPTGSVERVDGGFRVSGRWSFSSGCDHCSWVFLGGIAPGADGAPPDMRTYLIPRSDYQIDDNWHVAGLCATGSKDIVVEGAFVPEHRTHRFLDAFSLASPGQEVNRGPLYQLPFGSMFAWALLFPALGAAKGAIELFKERSRTRIATFDRTKVVEDPFTQVRLAESFAEWNAVLETARATWTRFYDLASAGQPIPVEQRAKGRWDAANGVQLCVRSVDRLFEASGGHAIFLDSPIQRMFRDVHAMRAHAINDPQRAARVFARTELTPEEGPGDLFL